MKKYIVVLMLSLGFISSVNAQNMKKQDKKEMKIGKKMEKGKMKKAMKKEGAEIKKEEKNK